MAKKPTAAPLTQNTRICVLVGDEPFLASEYTGQLKEILAKAFGEVDTIRFDGQSATIAEILDECRTFGLMQQHKLVVVDHAEQAIKEEARAVLERYVQSPSENATLVLRCVRWYPGKLDEMIAKVGTKIELEAITHEKAVIWTTRRAEKRHGAHVEPGAAEQLVTKLGVELGRIDTELEKLATFAGGGSPASPGQAPVRITEAMVAELVGMTREEEAWGLQDSILSGDAERALAHLRLILDNSRKDAAVPLSWACLDLARKLHSASRALKQGENAWSLAGRLRIFGTSRDQILATAGRVPPARMAAILKEAVASDLASKSGLGDPDRNLERLTLRFARALRG